MGRTDRAERIVDAPVDRVFAALVDPELLLRWLPPEGMTGRFEHVDIRPGGSYRLVLTYPPEATAHAKSTEDADVVDVRIVDVVPGDRVVQAVDFDSDDPSFSGTMTMTWQVHDEHRCTRVGITAQDVPPGIGEQDHADGLASSLANLARLVEQG
jgi:uncharacterized protein YndB with AHSA1/START domain